MALRLTNDLREDIANKAIKHAFDKRKDDLETQQYALAREAYEAAIPEEERKAAQKMPERWFRLDSCLRFNVGGLTITLKTGNNGYPVPYSSTCIRIGTIDAGPLCDRIRQWVTDQEKYRDERYVAIKQVLNMLSKVTTFKKLREVWPEGAQFYSSYEATPSAQLPAIRVDEVNVMLGLSATP